MSRLSAAAQGHLAMLCFSALVAGSFSLGAQVANEIAPTVLNAVRFALATLLVGGLAWARGDRFRAGFAAPWRYFVLAGLFTLYFVLMFEGLKTAPPVSAAAVFTLVPVMSAGVAWLLMRQVMTLRMALALAIGGIGALWVIFRGDLSAFLTFDVGRGEAIYFVGCICHAIYAPMVRWLNRGESAVLFTFGTLFAGTVLLTIYGWSDLVQTDWTGLRPLVWITILYVAVFATAATVVLLQFAALRLPSAKVMAYTYLTPSWVILWEAGFGNALPGALVWGGVALTILALYLLLRDDSREKS